MTQNELTGTLMSEKYRKSFLLAQYRNGNLKAQAELKRTIKNINSIESKLVAPPTTEYDRIHDALTVIHEKYCALYAQYQEDKNPDTLVELAKLDEQIVVMKKWLMTARDRERSYSYYQSEYV